MADEPIEQWRREFEREFSKHHTGSVVNHGGYESAFVKYLWLGFVMAKRSAPVPKGWQLVPKLLTPAMHTAIVHSAGDQTYISWPANCWENALEVAPAYEHK